MDQLSPTLTEPQSGAPFNPTNTVTSLRSLSKLIEKRAASWLYLQRAYSSSPDRWFQTVQISQLRIERYLVESLGSTRFTQKSRNLFVLGMSLGPVLDAESPTEFCRSMSRILDEWEVWNEGSMNGKGNGGVKNLFRNPRAARRSDAGTADQHDHHSFSNSTYSNSASNRTNGFSASRSDSALIKMNLPFTLDYCQIVITLCEMIRQLYHRLEELVSSPSFIGSMSSRYSVSSLPSGNRPGMGSYSSSFRGDGNLDARQGSWGNTASGKGGSHARETATGGLATSSTMLPTALTDQITKIDLKLRKILVSFTRDTENIARAAVDDELNSLLRGMNTAQTPGSNIVSAAFGEQQSTGLGAMEETGVMSR